MQIHYQKIDLLWAIARFMLTPVELDAINVLEKFDAHAERHRATRQPGVEPPESQIREREAIMDALIEASGFSAQQIQVGLGINRTTWERWRKMGSVPNRGHLDHLRRIIQERSGISDAPVSSPMLPGPLAFLSWSPRTYSQLRVAFLHRNYNWKDAVFHFKKPYEDDNSVVDMATLALNGCKIVYLLESSQLDGDEQTGWIYLFVQNMVSCLGRKTSSRALANFAFVELVENKKLEDEFGVLNFRSTNGDERVGYFWTGNTSSDAIKMTKKAATYTVHEADDDRFEILKRFYAKALDMAFKEIDKNNSNEVEYEFDYQIEKYPFVLPRINANSNILQKITVYVSP